MTYWVCLVCLIKVSILHRECTFTLFCGQAGSSVISLLKIILPLWLIPESIGVFGRGILWFFI